MTAQQVLQKYFGYSTFRPLQDEIITSVLAGRDTLALMPTGGGKSLCFQVPTLVMGETDPSRRLCLVITPLIALMKDQISILHERNIRAAAIYAGITHAEQMQILNNCRFGPYHFLYVSPERLESRLFREQMASLPLGLIAVDEAHCISQWGYDFRPSYLKIENIRQIWSSSPLNKNKRRVPILALTATATQTVVEDIQEKLNFEQCNVFRMSFARRNLHFSVENVEDKAVFLLHYLQTHSGSVIVYVRNRSNTKKIAEWLLSIGISASFYHAGLNTQERHARQEQWKKYPEEGGIQAMICTNAFGMGIDKPDVRTVIHYDLPDTLEAYYQEAGRAGRDGQDANAILLYANRDRSKIFQRVDYNFPTPAFVEQVYHAMADYLHVGVGSGLYHTFAFPLLEFCQVMHLPLLPTHSALKLLTYAHYIEFTEESEAMPRVQVKVPSEMLSDLALTEQAERVMDKLLRQYPGIFTEPQYIHENRICEDLHITRNELNSTLISLAQRRILLYIPRQRTPLITFVLERQEQITLPKSIYTLRKERYEQGLAKMLNYAEQRIKCRSLVLQQYFGEETDENCGHCDICQKALQE